MELDTESIPYKALTSSFANVLVLLLPFIGFVVGYVINILASLCERTVYKKGWITRPSAIILNNSSKYPVDNLENLKNRLGIIHVDNDSANIAFQKAKEKLSGNEVILTFHSQSILARNLACSQIILTIVCAFSIIKDCKVALIWFIVSLLLSILMVYNWKRQTCVYAKYVFSKYN